MRKLKQEIKEDIRNRFEECPGNLGFYYKSLTTGEEFGIQEDEVFLAASVIKLPIFAEICRQAWLGKVDMSEKITVLDEDKLPSCGALNSFTGPVTADIRTLCRLMITISDNTAANILIRRIGINALNSGFREMGMSKTRMERLLFDASAAEQGKENRIALREMGTLLEKIAQRSFVNEETSAEMEETLLQQQINHKICGKLSEDIPVAHKTGEDDGITNDIGIVYAKRPFLVCFAGNDTNVPQFEQHIRELSWLLWKEAEQD